MRKSINTESNEKNNKEL